jgi:hypothetical protein
MKSINIDAWLVNFMLSFIILKKSELKWNQLILVHD